MGKLTSTGKSFEISKWEVWDAWQRVKANKVLPVAEGDDDGAVHGEDEDRTNRTVVGVVRAYGGAVLCTVTRS